jgi:hypothetical protein
MTSSVAPDRWQKALLASDATIHQAIRNLVDSALQIVLVTSASGSAYCGG